MGKLLSIGALSLAGPFNVDLLAALPRGLAGVAAISFVLAAGLAWVIFRNTRQHATAVFLAAWMAITVLPQGGAPPAERLLFGVSVGSSGLLAMFLSATVFQKAALWRPRLSRTLGWAVLLSAGPLSAVSVPVQGFVLTRLTGEVRQTIVTAQVPPPNHRQREVFVLQSPSMLVPLPMGQTWVIETDDRLARFWPMQSGRRGLRWTRLDERTFELESLDQPFLANIMEKVFLSGRSAPIPGAKWETALFTVEAVETGPDGLRRFRVRCPDSLDAPGYRFLVSPDGRLEAIPPPQVGQAVLIPTAAPFHRFMP